MSKKARRRPSWKDGRRKKHSEEFKKLIKEKFGQLYHNLCVNQDISPGLRRLCLEVMGIFPMRED